MRMHGLMHWISQHLTSTRGSRIAACGTLAAGAVVFETARGALLGFAPTTLPILSFAGAPMRSSLATDDQPVRLWTQKEFGEKLASPVVVAVKVRVEGRPDDEAGQGVAPPSAAVEPIAPAQPSVPQPAASAKASVVASIAAGPTTSDVDETSSIPRHPAPTPAAAAATPEAETPAGGVVTLKVPRDVRIRGRNSFQIGRDVYRLEGLDKLVPNRIAGPRRDLRNAIAGETLTCRTLKASKSLATVTCTTSGRRTATRSRAAPARKFTLW